MNGTFATILRVILPPSLLFLFTLCKMKRNRKEEADVPLHAYTVLRQPKLWGWLGWIAILFLTILHALTICFSLGHERVFFLIFALLEVFVGLAVYSVLQWKLLLFRDEEFFQLTDFFSRPYAIRYEDCSCFQRHKHIIIIYNRVKPFFIGSYAARAGLLVAALRFHGIGSADD